MLKSMLDGSHSLSANIIFFGTLCWQVHIPTWPISLRRASLLSTFYLYVLYLEAITYLESCHIDNVINEVSMLHKWWGTKPRKPPIQVIEIIPDQKKKLWINNCEPFNSCFLFSFGNCKLQPWFFIWSANNICFCLQLDR